MEYQDSITIDLRYDGPGLLCNEIATDVQQFITHRLLLDTKQFSDAGGVLALMKTELEALAAVRGTPASDTWFFIDHWAEADFSSGLSNQAHSSRALLYLSFFNFQHSQTPAILAGRFEKSIFQLYEQAPLSSLYAWFKVWMRAHFPHLSLYLWGARTCKVLDTFQGISSDRIFKFLPVFMAWNLPSILKAKKYRWVARGLAQGRALRSLQDCPLPFTKKMAHCFINAPCHLNFDEAVWYALVKGLGGGKELIDALKNHYRHWQQDFGWISAVIRFFVYNRPADYGNMPNWLAYLQHRKDENAEFTMKGWSLASLDRRTNQWLRELVQHRQAPCVDHTRWKGADYPMFELEATSGTYRIVQLLDARSLREEGAGLLHCVGSYAQKCLHHSTSIWSLRLYQAGQYKRLITIEVNKYGTIIQARGKRNAHPRKYYLDLIRQWADSAGLQLLSV
jgi:hypothetical protein